ncbi:hypothetical protein Tco_0212175 [Tanacetum coccineum]
MAVMNYSSSGPALHEMTLAKTQFQDCAKPLFNIVVPLPRMIWDLLVSTTCFAELHLNPLSGLQISQSPKGIFINQSKYALESLKKYSMKSSNPVDTPPSVEINWDEGYTREAVAYHNIVEWWAPLYVSHSQRLSPYIFLLHVVALRERIGIFINTAREGEVFTRRPDENHWQMKQKNSGGGRSRCIQDRLHGLLLNLSSWLASFDFKPSSFLSSALFQPHGKRDISSSFSMHHLNSQREAKTTSYERLRGRPTAATKEPYDSII